MKIEIRKLEPIQTVLDFFIHRAGLADTGKISLGIRKENRHAAVAERFSQHFQGNGFSCSCSTCDQAMAIGHFGINKYIFFS